MLEKHNLKKFNQLRGQAEAASRDSDYPLALEKFEKADDLAVTHDDDSRRLQILAPIARLLWSTGRYDEAAEKLDIVHNITSGLEEDEQGMSISALARLATNRIVRTAPANRQAWLLQREAIPRYEQCYEMLKDHPHFYYRYENAEHGSIAAALGGDRELAIVLILEGLEAAFRKPEETYGDKLAFEMNPGGLLRLVGAVTLIPLGNRTPLLASFIKSKLIN